MQVRSAAARVAVPELPREERDGAVEATAYAVPRSRAPVATAVGVRRDADVAEAVHRDRRSRPSGQTRKLLSYG